MALEKTTSNLRNQYSCVLVLALVLLPILVFVSCSSSSAREIVNDDKVDLPKEHLPSQQLISENGRDLVPDDCARSQILDDTAVSATAATNSNYNCPHFKAEKDEEFRSHLNQNVCWGYENDCESYDKENTSKLESARNATDRYVQKRKRYSSAMCNGDSKGWVKTKEEQILTFYNQADFGYVKKYRDSILPICESQHKDDSSLECSEHLTFCRGRNLFIDFRGIVHRKQPIMYDTDVLSSGHIGGHCKLNSQRLKDNLEYMGSLQSWGPEIQHFISISERILTEHGSISLICDKIITRPTFILKIDATVNMYHHFCDFFNLYASLHTNFTKSQPEMFSKDVQILIWRSFPYKSNFEAAFKPFTKHPIIDLSHLAGKRVCFSNVMFPLLPRMIFGLYYNTPLIWGCEKSGLFHAFSKFMLHRLKIQQRNAPDVKEIRITFLSRQTRYRRILNEELLISELKKLPGLLVRKVQFTFETDFLEQLQIIQDTDILIGIHGAGLTHSIFLPDWGVLFEIYNCEDPNCYADLARLRGLKYLTWQDESKLKVVEKNPKMDSTFYHKHSNYKFNPVEFLRIAQEGIDHVKMKFKELKNTHTTHNEL